MRHLLGPSALCLVVLVWASPAFAQGPSRRPYQALFGNGYGDATQMLRGSATAGAAFTSDVEADSRGGFGGRAFRREGAQFSGLLSYVFQRSWFSANGLGSARYSPNARNGVVPMGAGGVSVRRALGNRVTASASASVLYRPYWYGSIFLGGDGSSPEDMMPSTDRSLGRRVLLGNDDGELIPPPVEDDIRESEWDLAASSTGYVAYTAGANLTHRLSNRTAYSGHYNYRMTPGIGPSSHFERQSVGAEIHHAVGRGLTVRGGYTYGESQRGLGRTHEHHAIDAGLGYRRALSISRRTTLSFSTGSFGRQTNNTTRFRITGSAMVNHELGRSWSVAGTFGRSVLLYEAYDEPVVRDGVSVRVHGLLTRRVSFTGSARTGLGSIGFEQGAPAFTAVHAAAVAGIAINRFTRGSIVYSYYMHRFDQGTDMAIDTPLALDRHSVRAQVTVWAPLFYRVGGPNASR